MDYSWHSMYIMLVGECECKAYTTIVKGLAGADLDIVDLIRRCQEITKLQCQLIQQKKAIDWKLDVKIALKCRLEQQKAAIWLMLKFWVLQYQVQMTK